MNVCPGLIAVRRKKETEEDIETDRISIDPTDDCIALIKNIVIHFDESVSVRFLSFHVKNKFYCKKYKVPEAEKKFCDIKNINYVHFHFSVDGFPSHESEYFVAFLPRFKDYSELQALVNELCTVAEWLKLKQIHYVVFRYGAPVHGISDSMVWQKKLNAITKNTREFSTVYKIEGRIGSVITSQKNKSLTLSKNAFWVNFNVS